MMLRPRSRSTTQVLRFLTVGLLAAVADYVTYRAGLEAGMVASTAKALGFIIATTLAYAANRRWTFGARHSPRRVWRFVSVYAATLLWNVTVNSVLLAGLPDRPGAVTGAWLVAQATTSALNFIALRNYVFTSKA